jgi:hypothetical protein
LSIRPEAPAYTSAGRVLNHQTNQPKGKTMTTLTIGTAVDALAEQTARQGGATVSILPGVPQPASGYAVSLKGHEQRRSLEAVNYLPSFIRRQAFAYADEHRNLLAQPGHYLGAWIDGALLFLDVTRVHAEFAEAQRAGIANGQRAIFDLGRKVEYVRAPGLDLYVPFAVGAVRRGLDG